MLGIGFIGSLWFSWIYDITPGGIVKTEPYIDEKVPIPRKKLKTHQATTFISIAIIIVLLTYRLIDHARSKQIASLEKTIAVLPFYDPGLEYQQIRNFEFIGHEITSCLLKVKDYKVIPWEDARKYSRTNKNYTKMGDDLSAAILVDWKPNETTAEKLLSVDLIAVEDESLLWSENFRIKGNWSASEIFKCSRRISRMINKTLRVYLTLEEKARVYQQPVSAQASMYATIGRSVTNDALEIAQTGELSGDTLKNEYIDSISFNRAINYFTEALQTYPDYAIAYAERAKAKLWGIKTGYFDRNILDECEKDILKAFELNPDLPEAHVAMGYYYFYGMGDYMLALTSLEKAVELRPDNSEYLFHLSRVHFSLGNWDELQFLSDKVFDSNPRNVLYLTNLGISYIYLHDVVKSLQCQDRAIELKPAWLAPYYNKSIALLAIGDLQEAKKVMLEAEKKTHKRLNRRIAQLYLYEGDYIRAIDRIEKPRNTEASDFGENEGDIALTRATIYKYAGQSTKSMGNYKIALKFFIQQVMFNPRNGFDLTKLGIAYAGLGMKQEAIKCGQEALKLMIKQENPIYDPYILYNMAVLFNMVGEDSTSLQIINDLLHRKSPFTIESMKLDPDLKYLVNNSGFALLNH